jgi:hypothetical protein
MPVLRRIAHLGYAPRLIPDTHNMTRAVRNYSTWTRALRVR